VHLDGNSNTYSLRIADRSWRLVGLKSSVPAYFGLDGLAARPATTHQRLLSSLQQLPSLQVIIGGMSYDDETGYSPSPSDRRSGFMSVGTSFSDIACFSRNSSVPSPQAWLASSKQKPMPHALDPPPSPLELLLPVRISQQCLMLHGAHQHDNCDADRFLVQITHALDDLEWNNRLSLLTYRYYRENSFLSDPDIVEKAFKTLELFCVSDVARDSLLVSLASPDWRWNSKWYGSMWQRSGSSCTIASSEFLDPWCSCTKALISFLDSPVLVFCLPTYLTDR